MSRWWERDLRSHLAAVSLHRDCERQTHDVLWAELTFLANGPAVEIQLRRARPLGGKSPDTGICGIRGVASRYLQFQRALRSSGTAPRLAKRQLNLDHIAKMSIDSCFAIRGFQHHRGWSRGSAHHDIVGTAMDIRTGRGWGGGS